MKRAALLFLLAISTIVLTSQSAEAGTGKSKKAKIQIKNTNATSGRSITIFVAPEGSTVPKTKAQALAFSRKTIGPGKTEIFNLKGGNYIVVAADTASFNSLSNSSTIPAGSFSTKTVAVIQNSTVALTTNTPAGSTSPFKPNLN